VISFVTDVRESSSILHLRFVWIQDRARSFVSISRCVCDEHGQRALYVLTAIKTLVLILRKKREIKEKRGLIDRYLKPDIAAGNIWLPGLVSSARNPRWNDEIGLREITTSMNHVPVPLHTRALCSVG
jgi:hypothetical protein